MKTPRPILVAGIGHMFLGDDAFGSEVARALKHHVWPDHVRVEDFGVRSYDLAYALMDGSDAVLIDAVPLGYAPGTVYLADLEHLPAAPPDSHGMNPASVLRLVQSLGGTTGRLFLVGCEPGALESENGPCGLSAPVQAAVPGAVALVESVVADLIYNKNPVYRNPIRPALAGSLKETG